MFSGFGQTVVQGFGFGVGSAVVSRVCLALHTPHLMCVDGYRSDQPSSFPPFSTFP